MFLLQKHQEIGGDHFENKCLSIIITSRRVIIAKAKKTIQDHTVAKVCKDFVLTSNIPLVIFLHFVIDIITELVGLRVVQFEITRPITP